MTTGSSRLSRWQDGSGPELRGASAASRSASLQDQAQAAVETLMVASRSARDRLDRWRGRQESRIGQIAALGAGGLAGLLGLLAVPMFDRTTTLGLAGVAALTVLGAGFGLAREAWPRKRASDDISCNIAGDAALGTEAKRLVLLAAMLEERPATTAQTLLSRLIADAELATSVARDREARIRGEANLRGRRHERLVPRQTRVVLTTPDQRSLHAQIVDVSLSGVAVDGNFPGCAVGGVVRVGSRKARVVRVLPRGLACEFVELLPPALLTADIVL